MFKCDLNICDWTLTSKKINNKIKGAIMMQLPLGIKEDCECDMPALVGDGFCNDETNNIDCNYDGGDCCGSCVVDKFCSQCECITGVNVGEINNPLIGNGFCNDETNNELCNYDGGDCCGFCVVKNYCSSCICYAEFNDTLTFNPLVGDGFCSDESNTVECNYDGFECCGLNVNRELCSQCSCLGIYSICLH